MPGVRDSVGCAVINVGAGGVELIHRGEGGQLADLELELLGLLPGVVGVTYKGNEFASLSR